MPTKTFTTSTRTEPVVLVVDDEEFVCADNAAANRILEVGILATSDDPKERQSAIPDFLSSVMEPEAWTRFSERMSSRDKPITIDVVSESVMWLLEVYTGANPAVPSPSVDS